MTSIKEAPPQKRAVGGRSLGAETFRAQLRNRQTKELLGEELSEELAQPLTKRDATIRLLRDHLDVDPALSGGISNGEVVMGSREFGALPHKRPMRTRTSRP